MVCLYHDVSHVFSKYLDHGSPVHRLNTCMVSLLKKQEINFLFVTELSNEKIIYSYLIFE